MTDKTATINLPKNFYLFYDGNEVIDTVICDSNKLAIEHGKHLVNNRNKAITVAKGIARIVPSMTLSEYKELQSQKANTII